MKKAILTILDSLGIGALPDAADFGDAGANTLGHIIEAVPGLNIPNLRDLGLGNIYGMEKYKLGVEQPIGAFGRMAELSKGKDTITGHWELMGIETKKPFKTYEKFPADFMKKFEKKIGMGTLGNYAASGTEIINVLGPEHEKTGKPIIYTSADSVFQIAANTDVIPLEKLYEICGTAREMLTGDVAVGRVIARPYMIENGKRIRTSDRKDYSVSPPRDTVLDGLIEAKKEVVAIGKISDIFNGKGISRSIHTGSNEDGCNAMIKTMEEDFEGLIFTNLVDFDSKFGHRRDAAGYAKALEEFDRRLPEIFEVLSAEDILILCADHGNDPAHSGWDHTREYVPLIIFGDTVTPGDLGTSDTFADVGATIADFFGSRKPVIGKSLLGVMT